jgi:hypothetical protein
MGEEPEILCAVEKKQGQRRGDQVPSLASPCVYPLAGMCEHICVEKKPRNQYSKAVDVFLLLFLIFFLSFFML